MDKQTLKFFEDLPLWIPREIPPTSLGSFGGSKDNVFACINACLSVTNPLLRYEQDDHGEWRLKVGRTHEE